MGSIRIEVDARDVSGLSGLVSLKQEVSTVVVIGIGFVLVGQDEISILVRLGLGGFYFCRSGRICTRSREQWTVIVIAVEANQRGRILDRHCTLSYGSFHKLRRKNVRLPNA